MLSYIQPVDFKLLKRIESSLSIAKLGASLKDCYIGYLIWQNVLCVHQVPILDSFGSESVCACACHYD
jgi:hypothetical protein